MKSARSGAPNLQRAIALFSACPNLFCARTILQHLLERVRRPKRTVFSARSSFWAPVGDALSQLLIYYYEVKNHVFSNIKNNFSMHISVPTN